MASLEMDGSGVIPPTPSIPKMAYFFAGHEQPAILDAQVAMLEYWSKTVGTPRTPALVLEIFTKDQQFILDRLLGLQIYKKLPFFVDDAGNLTVVEHE